VQSSVGLHHFAQAPVDAKANRRVLLVGLDVDIAGSIARGLGEQRIEHANDGRVVLSLEQVFDGGQLLHHARQVHIGLYLADHGGCARFALRIGAADVLHQIRLGQILDRQWQVALGVLAHHLADCRAVAARAKPQSQPGRVLAQQQSVAACEGVRQQVAHGFFRVWLALWALAGSRLERRGWTALGSTAASDPGFDRARPVQELALPATAKSG